MKPALALAGARGPRRALAALACALALGAPLASTAAPSPAAALPELSLETARLDNGLTVILNRDARVPVVAVEVRYLVGSGHEPKGKSGFAHLFEHLMFQGSENYNNEYFAPFEPIGGSINGTTSTDRTNYYQRVPAEYLELALWMESDRMGHFLGALDLAKLDNQRDVVKNERRQRYENTPYGMAWKYLQEDLFLVGHPYQHTTIGSHEDLTAASLEDVKAFFRQYYAPSNAILTIVGDIDPAATLVLVERYFGAIPPGERAATPRDEPPARPVARHKTYTDSVKLPRIHLTWPSPALYGPGDAALDLWSSVLTDGKTSRLYKRLVYEQKVAKDVQAFQYSRQVVGSYVIIATAAPGQTVEALGAALDAALREALSAPPSADELARALNGWRKSFFAQGESVLSRAQQLSTYAHLAGRADFLADDLARYTSQTPQTVHDAARQYLLPDAALRIDIVPGDKPQESGDAPGGAP